MVNLPIFIMLLGILVSVANLTASTWNYEPTEQTIETLDANTAVTFANPSGEKLAKKGDYEVAILPLSAAPGSAVPMGPASPPPKPVCHDIPEKYRLPSTSGLKHTVTSGSNSNDFNVDMQP